MTKTIPRLALLSAVLTYVTLLIDSALRHVGPGNSQLESLHLIAVTLVAIATLALVASIWSSQQFRTTVGQLAGIAVILLGIQLGLTTITIPVAVHLLLGTTFFGLMIWIRRKTISISTAIAPLTMSTSKTRVFSNHVRVSLVLVFIQIALGGLISSNGAGLVCSDFPTCDGLWFPPLIGLVGLQMVHRYVAYAILLIVIGTVAIARRAVLDPVDRRLVRLCLIAVITQVLLGVGLIHAKLPVPMSVAHLGITLFLFGLLTALAFGTRRA